VSTSASVPPRELPVRRKIRTQLEDAMTTNTQAPKDPMGFLNYYLVNKAPIQIPDNIRELIVAYGPWITVILLVLSLPVLLVVFGLGVGLLPFGGPAYAAGFGLGALLFCVQLVLEIASLPGLFARKMTGWTLMFYAQAVGVLSSLMYGAIVSAIVVGVIVFYVMFQVRGLYK
jgi:hypothetical protein